MTDSDNEQRGGLSLTALTAEDLAILLSKASGKPLNVEMLKRHIANGAPVNADGTVNLVHYAAYLAREVAGGD